MEFKVTKLEACHVQVDVVVDEASWKAAQEKSYAKLAKQVTVDGFRKGHVPENIARKHINPMKMFDEAINSLLPGIYKDILEKENIEPFAQPKLDVTKMSETELEVRFLIITAPEVKLGKYKGLKLGKEEAKVTDEDVNKAIDTLREQNASLILKEDAAALGDTVVFDFVGTVDGVAFEGGSAQNYSLELGSGQFIPGFEDQLVGVKADEHRDVNVTFPEAYDPKLAGKAAVFACDVHEVKMKKMPELDDDFVKELNIKGVETVDALKENKKQELLDSKARELRNAYLKKLYEEIASKSEINIAQEMITEQAEKSKQDMVQRMQQSGFSLEQYLTYVGQSEEDFMAKLVEDAKRDITNYFILEEVGKLEKIEVTDADLEFEYAKLADQYSMTIDAVKKALENQVRDFKNNLRLTRIEEFLFDNNN